ncbi:50S ribosomal protein L23 [Streptomyces boninensis]|uniref:50S ribosomal protein L23 n=1 Tax=Streptomyces boninensis TaxID=2039455 RepID=UPI003B217CE7
MATRHPSIASKAAKAAKAARKAKAARHAAEGKATVETPVSKSFTDLRDVLLKPVVSEKSYALLDDNKYTFIVDPRANKTQIKQAVETVFTVKVTGVNTINRQGKRKRTRTGFGKRADTKRAIVTLAEGDRIDIFGGPVS